MKRGWIVLCAVFVAALVLPLTFGPLELPPQQGGVAEASNQPGVAMVEPDTCDKCSLDRCGCAAPSAGCTLTASCSCGDGSCSVNCVYQCE